MTIANIDDIRRVVRELAGAVREDARRHSYRPRVWDAMLKAEELCESLKPRPAPEADTEDRVIVCEVSEPVTNPQDIGHPGIAFVGVRNPVAITMAPDDRWFDLARDICGGKANG